EIRRLDDQRAALPPASRIPIPLAYVIADMRTFVQRDDACVQPLAEHDDPARRLRDERSAVVPLRSVRRVLRDAASHRGKVLPRVISCAVATAPCRLNR